jgi:uncharacterized protein YcbX
MSHATQPQIGAVVALWRCPVKSMQGEEVQTARVRDHRLLGDRAYAVLDRAVARSPRPRTLENGRISSRSGPPSSCHPAAARRCLRCA